MYLSQTVVLTHLDWKHAQMFSFLTEKLGLWWLSRYSTDQQIQTVDAAVPRSNPATGPQSPESVQVT
jgi:hypothetical protein